MRAFEACENAAAGIGAPHGRQPRCTSRWAIHGNASDAAPTTAASSPPASEQREPDGPTAARRGGRLQPSAAQAHRQAPSSAMPSTPEHGHLPEPVDEPVQEPDRRARDEHAREVAIPARRDAAATSDASARGSRRRAPCRRSRSARAAGSRGCADRAAPRRFGAAAGTARGSCRRRSPAPDAARTRSGRPARSRSGCCRVHRSATQLPVGSPPYLKLCQSESSALPRPSHGEPGHREHSGRRDDHHADPADRARDENATGRRPLRTSSRRRRGAPPTRGRDRSRGS